jgi:hypothetical protein
MADIYENAHLTIAATWSTDSNTGLLSSTPNKYKAHKLERSRLHVRKPPPRFPTTAFQLRFQEDSNWPNAWPLLQRAWVYQERRLSPRIVHYGEHQIRWECKSAFLAEDGASEKVEPLHESFQQSTNSMNFKSSPSSPKDAWRKIVEEYTQMNLTYETDRLAAVAAVVKKEMQVRPADVYIAGMWKSTLLEDLAWASNIASGTSDYSRPPLCAPTWSWVSTRGPTHWMHSIIMPALHLEDVCFTPFGPAHLGQVQNASIRLRGPFFTAKFYNMPDEFKFVDYDDYLELSPDTPHVQDVEIWAAVPDFDYTLGERPVVSGQLVTIVPVMRTPFGPDCHALILRTATDTTFERIGLVHLKSRDWGDNMTPEELVVERNIMTEFVASLPIRQVTII